MLSKEYQSTAQTLRRVARNMVDQAVADRLEALAKGYEQRAEEAMLTDNALERPAVRSERMKKARTTACDFGQALAKDAAE